MTPKPPAAGGCTPRLEPKKKLFIQLHSASLPLPAHRYRFTLSVPGLLNQLPSQILLCQARCGWRLLPPRRASAAFALRSPASLGRGADVSVAMLWKHHRLILPACPVKPYGELHANSAQALQEHSGSPAVPNGSCFSGRRLPSNHQPPGPVFLRGPYGLPCGAMEPSAEGALQFRRIRFAKFGNLLHSVTTFPPIDLRRRTRSLSGAESFGTLKVA